MRVNPSKKIFHQDALDLFISEIRRDIRFQQKFQQCSTFSKFSTLDLEKASFDRTILRSFDSHRNRPISWGVLHFRFLVGLSCFVLRVSGPEVGKITSG